ncbi:MlaD family protein [Mycobacterium sp. 236(2023)]|uniref:MCE family protein n=1 Tax=Mycobacterium sp. 236(2023) TaxID=3038163 RepID=UPI00241567C2|nr:MlaD family protein [Mycobacterium sp. 236(2023)]MDG4668065.1 MlaD family protein [Mycobacterium sp. 236(2023)]
MKNSFAASMRSLTVFVLACLLGALTLVLVFAQVRFEGSDRSYRAEFTNVSGLSGGNFVRIAGVEVGKVQNISVTRGGTAIVEFAVDDTVILTESTRALVRYDNPIGGRFLELQEGPGGARTLDPGQTIALDQTRPALDLDAVIGGFRPLFRAMDPEQVNQLSTQLIQAFQGQGATISSLLSQTAIFTNTLADRDELIGQVITNLNGVLGSLGGQSDQLASAVDSLSQLTGQLSARRDELSTSIAQSNAASSSIADLLVQARPPLKNTVAQTDRVAAIAVADHEYLDNLLNTLPDAYQRLGRQGLYGDFFNFYLCDLIIKLNGKGGEPVYVKLAGQSTGRCAPK